MIVAAHPYWQGEKVQLRGVEPDDAAFFFGWNDVEMMRGLAEIWPPGSLVRTQEWIRNQTIDEPRKDQHFCVIADRTGQPVGSINAHTTNPRHGTFRYGIAIHHDHCGRGYASEAIVLFMRYFFEELRYQKANATVYEFNLPSIRLHEKLGFVPEGRLRRIIYTQGRYYDELQYGMTAEEFAARYGSQPLAPPP